MMPRIEHGDVYLTAQEAANYLRISRTAFQHNIRPHVQGYQFPGLKRVFFKQADLDQFKGARPVKKREE